MSLTNDQVLDIRKKYGWNEIVSSKMESGLSLFKDILLDPMGLMLLTLGFIYLLFGKTSDAIVLFISYIPVTAVDVMLGLRAKKALSALKASLKPTAKVVRNDKIVEISIREIVPNDVIIFEEGQSLAADGKIAECDQLQMNEAALTGESIPVDKVRGDPFFCGTVILQGRGLGFVEKIARDTKFGKIAELLEDTAAETSPLKKKVNAVVKRVLVIAIVVAILLFVVTFLKNDNFSQSLIEALTFGMAAIPEEFPLVFTLYLSLGAYRLSKHGVLVKSLPSVETLGGVDVICTDKTGTLTEGKFQLESLESLEIFESSDHEFTNEIIWLSALMACEEKAVDTMETAIFEKGKDFKILLNNWNLIWDYPFEIVGKHMSHVWINKTNNETMISMKGSIEGVVEHCKLDLLEKNQIEKQVIFWASKGKRLLGLASRLGPCIGDRIEDEKNLKFIGLLIFSDPIRQSAKVAVAKCQESGITIKMLTGDHPLTAHAVADELGILHSHDSLYTGDQLLKMSKEERWMAYQQGAIFSRVLPEQKYEMVTALKNLGKIVAMTGDGINDAPALKTADIGISMGQNASDVARNSAQMVLMKNDFQGIIEAVLEGRKIFSNLKRSFSYLISFHIPILFFALLPPLLGYGNLLLPIHIVLLQLVVHPVSAFSFENLPSTKSFHEKTLMNPLRFWESFLSGLLLSLGSLYLFQQVLPLSDIVMARSVVIATIMLGNIFFILLESLPKLTLRFILTTICLVFFIGMILYVKFFSEVFYLTGISFKFMFLGFIVAFLAILPILILRQIRLLKK
jgi:Ca2+-transporting ATPase